VIRPARRGVQLTSADVPVARRSGSRAVARPALFGVLEQAVRVTLVSAPAGSGKTVLLRSWIEQKRVESRTAWVSVGRSEHDLQKFWTSVVAALHATELGSGVLQTLEPAPSLDGWEIVERLLKELAELKQRLWLVIDDLHELRSNEALRQIELLLLRVPEPLRFVLLTRHDLRIGLHRLRLEGDLTEIRGSDLRFTAEEARGLFTDAGVALSDRALNPLMERTEGWVAGLRLAALSMARHPDPERFAIDFSGSERTISEYLLAEVLERQPPEVKRLLLRTSLLDRFSGPLADALTDGTGGELILQALEDANGFVTSIDTARSWFRYHHLFADLLRLELRRSAAAEIPMLHATAARWYAAHGHPIDAIRHAQAAQDWQLATELLADHWLALHLGGQAATVHQLMTRFPAGIVSSDAELAALMAADKLDRGSLDEAEHHLRHATQTSESLRQERTGRHRVMLAVVGLSLGRQRGNLAAVIDESEKLLAAPEAHVDQLRLAEDLRAFALISLGVAETNLSRIEGERHLEQGIAIAQRVERPYLEVYGLAYWAAIGILLHPHAVVVDRATRAVELARRHGWSEEPVVAVAYLILAAVRLWQARWDETAEWLNLAARTLRPELDPGAGEPLYLIRGELELMRGRYAEAVHALRSGARPAQLLVSSRPIGIQRHSALLLTLLKMGETEQVERALAALIETPGAAGPMQLPLAALRLAQRNPQAASTALQPLLSGTASVFHRNWLVVALVLEAHARDLLGEPAASANALERALDLAEPDGVAAPFLLYPTAQLLERHRGRRTTHAALISTVLDRIASCDGNAAPKPTEENRLREPLSKSEVRLLRYLPTNLSAPEIAQELHVSVHTVKTHMRNVYAKLEVHERSEAIRRARALGLLAPNARPV